MSAWEEKKIAYFCYDNTNIIIMRKHFVTALAMVACVSAVAATKPMPKLTFDASKGVAGSVTMPQGQIVHYTAYTNLLLRPIGIFAMAHVIETPLFRYPLTLR